MIFIFLPAAVAAETGGVSVGVEYLSSRNEFTVDFGTLAVDQDNDSNAIGINLGFMRNNNGQWFLAYHRESFDSGIYDNNNDALHYFSFGYAHRFPLGTGFAPYIRGSLGSGYMDVSGYSENEASVLGLKIGAGLSYRVVPNIELMGGLDIQSRSWSSVTLNGYEIELSDTSAVASIGLNYYF